MLYPTVMGLDLLFKKPDFIDFPTWMLFSNFCSVAITGWFAVPWISGIYQQRLKGKGTKKERVLALGTIIFILLLLLQFFRMIR
jgi:antibiotic biosynthesis monooxygenase (ABM) superfamily enzyme